MLPVHYAHFSLYRSHAEQSRQSETLYLSSLPLIIKKSGNKLHAVF